MNRYKLICQYCDYSWEINYAPKEAVYCSKCGDVSIKAVDLRAEKIDYYAGSPPFPNDNIKDPDWNF